MAAADRKGISRFAILTAWAGFLLVIAGGLVTSTGSGLAVPDWPLSYGTLFPPMVGGIRFEHSHRVIAAVVGLLTFALTVWILLVEKKGSVRKLACAAFGMVVLQGIAGGLTVLWQLPAAVSVIHACLGQTFFATLVLCAAVTSPKWNDSSRKTISPSLRRWAPAATVILYAQLLAGALLRHTRWSHPLILLHLTGAVLVLGIVGKTSALLLNDDADAHLNRLGHILRNLLFVQFLLGISTFAGLGRPFIATTHVAVGALLLATSVIITTKVWKGPFVLRETLSVYLELAKPRLTALAVITTLIGFLLGSAPEIIGHDWKSFAVWKLFMTLFGTALIGASAGTLNQYLEREWDGRMNRTKNRPLPSGRISPDNALTFGVLCSIGGLAVLTAAAHPLAGILAALTLVFYLLIYTPLKRFSALCTLVGAIPGALPPLIGWVAARGRLGLEGWLLFSILFLWQLPHFLAIAWTYREDYAKVPFQMLPVLDPEGGSTGRQIALYCVALLLVSLLPTFFGFTGPLYFLGALVSGLFFLWFGLRTAWIRSGAAARQLFIASILYLPAILTLMTFDRLLLY